MLWFDKNSCKHEKETHIHQWEIIDKILIYPEKKNDKIQNFWTVTYNEIDLLDFKNKKEEHPIGIYILQKCKECGELKETKTMFNE